MIINSSNHTKKIFFFLSACLVITSYAREEDVFEHVWEGNIALPTSQQPATFFGLGQTIVDKNDLLTYLFYDYIKGNKKKYTIVTPGILLGISDDIALFIQAPIAIDLKDGDVRVDDIRLSGAGNVNVQCEYAYFNKDKLTYAVQGTVLGNVRLPTGSFKNSPSTNFGSINFLLGTTMSYLSIDSYSFLSLGTVLNTSHRGDKAGNQYLYQGGFGRNIAYRSQEWILSWIFELNGTYAEQNKVNKKKDENSGGNTILADFNLWFATQKLTLIGSIITPITEHLFGQQNKQQYTFELIVGWKFN